MKQDERGYRYFQMPARNVNRSAFVVLLLLFIGAQLFGNAQIKKQEDMTTTSDEAAIRVLEDSLIAAFNSGDIDAIMKNYVPDKTFILYDVVPRNDYRGADLYRGAWAEMFSHFEGRPTMTYSNLGITVDGNVGFGNCFMHVAGTDKRGQPVDRWVRVTNGYRKIDGKWLIALEHISVPVDFSTGKLVPITKP